ncbi:MAG: hypothetical protein V4447_10750 [Pseudomonadota bacterium]
MPQAALVKRTYDSRLYDIACGNLLLPTEVITQVVSVLDDQNTLTFGTAAVNTQPVVYPGYTAPIGTVIQVQISGGVIPAVLPQLPCTIRAKFKTNISPDQLEATMLLVLRDTIPGSI